ncbi:MAG: sugar ABC transporter ATP-binding protein [Oscillospiraceae bacterium]
MQIEMRGITKSFGGNKVLDDAQFSLADSEIHALVGENGAGKSTLMKILTGVYSRDSGEVLVDGKPVHYTHPNQAAAEGIVFIYQELNVMFDLTVEENMFMGREITKKAGILDKKKMQRLCAEALERLGVSIPVNATMKDLSVGQQQMIEIAKALMWDVKVIIMDEPTAALTPKETEVLFKVANKLRGEGVSIIYISHRLEEIFELCDRVTVLRDGKFIETKNISDTDMNDMVKMMIGRDIGDRYPKRSCKIGEDVMEVRGLCKKGAFKDISFSVRAGEVLGVSGLMGAGRTEIMQSIFGNLRSDSGDIIMCGKAVRITSPEKAKALGLGYITEDRKSEGLMLEDSIKKNITLTNFDAVSSGGVLNFKREESLAQRAIRELLIRCFGSCQECSKLSGGNQQKVVFAKWSLLNPKLLILDEPTRGVDVGAKKEIYSIINQLAETGVAIIMVSSELPEILGMSDRVMVVHEGEIGGFLDNHDDSLPAWQRASEENVMILATGGSLHE